MPDSITWTELPNYITALSTLALVFVTCILAWITKRLIDVSSSPQIIAILKPCQWSRMHIDIEMENTGNATAFDIRTVFTPPLVTDRNTNDSTPAPFATVGVLKPGQVLTSFIGAAGAYLDQEYSITISWARTPAQSKKRESITYDVNLLHYENTSTLGDGNGDPAIAAYQEFKKISQNLVPWLKASRRTSVDIFNAQDRVREREERDAQLARMRAKREGRATPPENDTDTPK